MNRDVLQRRAKRKTFVSLQVSFDRQWPFYKNYVLASTIKVLFTCSLLVILSRCDLRAQSQPERFTFIFHTFGNSTDPIEHADTIRPYLTSGGVPRVFAAALVDSNSKFFYQFLLQHNIVVIFGTPDFGMISLPTALNSRSGQTRLTVDSIPMALGDYITTKGKCLFVGDTDLAISGHSYHVNHYEYWNEIRSKDTSSLPSLRTTASFFLANSAPFLIKEIISASMTIGPKGDTYRSSLEYKP